MRDLGAESTIAQQADVRMVGVEGEGRNTGPCGADRRGQGLATGNYPDAWSAD